MRQSILYAHKTPWPQYGEDRKPHPLYGQLMFADVMLHAEVVKLYDDGEAPVYKILVREANSQEKSYYWAWWDNQDQQF